jgi:hypothetical protein
MAGAFLRLKVSELDENEIADNLNEVDSGIEKAFDRYLESLLNPTGKVIHIVCNKKTQFGIGSHLAESARNFGASKFYSLESSL